MTIKEKCAAMRAELKKLGYNSKQVSVRGGYCGYSDRAEITIKDLKADRKAIEKVCKKFQSIDYDCASGEILQGANTFINIEYDYDIMRNAIEEERKNLDSMISEIEKEQKHIKKNDSEYVLFKQGDSFCMVVYENGSSSGNIIIRPTNNVDQFKYSLATYLVTDFNY
jgi:hypothetical protein